MAVPRRFEEHEGYEDDDDMDTDSNHSSSAPNSEHEFIDDDEPPDIELDALENDEVTRPIPVIVRLIPSPIVNGPPILELWGARPFGYAGESVIWTTYRAEPESDDVDDDAGFWEPLGIRVDPEEYHRAWVVRPTPQTRTQPPMAPPVLHIDYAREQVQPNPNALLIKTFGYLPERIDVDYNSPRISTFWLVGCGKVTDRKDLKRIRMKVDVYINVVKRGRQ